MSFVNTSDVILINHSCSLLPVFVVALCQQPENGLLKKALMFARQRFLDLKVCTVCMHIMCDDMYYFCMSQMKRWQGTPQPFQRMLGHLSIPVSRKTLKVANQCLMNVLWIPMRYQGLAHVKKIQKKVGNNIWNNLVSFPGPVSMLLRCDRGHGIWCHIMYYICRWI